MNLPQRRRPPDDPNESGAALVEFAVVFPIVMALLFGLISLFYLGFQNSALHNGASAGSRAASIQTSLMTPNGGQYCESSQPASIEQTVAHAAALLPVNPAPLCATTSNATQLTQTPAVANKVNITVTCGNNCSAPTSVSVSLTYNAKGIAFTDSMQATSQMTTLSP